MSITRNVLIVGPSWVGDMVIAEALFKQLRHNDPTTHIDVVAPQWCFPLLSRMPEVRRAIVSPLQHGRLRLRAIYRCAKDLQRQSYDQAIVLPNSWKSALIPFLANIPIRTGWRGEGRYILLNDRRVLDEKRYPSMVERFLALGISNSDDLCRMPWLQHNDLWPKLVVDESERNVALAKYSLSSTNGPILALCPGAAFGSAKCWPPAYFAEIANRYLAQSGRVLLFGASSECSLGTMIQAQTDNRCIDLDGQTNLTEVIDLLSIVDSVVANDSGLMHIAAALNRPLIAIYGPTSSTFAPPLSKTAQILEVNLPCRGCFQRKCPEKHHRCMTEVTPDKVWHALQQLKGSQSSQLKL